MSLISDLWWNTLGYVKILFHCISPNGFSIHHILLWWLWNSAFLFLSSLLCLLAFFSKGGLSLLIASKKKKKKPPPPPPVDSWILFYLVCYNPVIIYLDAHIVPNLASGSPLNVFLYLWHIFLSLGYFLNFWHKKMFHAYLEIRNFPKDLENGV